MQILVIGAGVIGAAIAFQLTRRGHEVTILEGQGIAAGASGRSFGWINASYGLSPAHYHLRREGIAAHRRLDGLLPSSPTRWPGCMWFESQGEEQLRFAKELRAMDYPVEEWDQTRIKAALPQLGQSPETALYLPTEGAVDPGELAQRLIAASGGRLWRGIAVHALVETQGKVTGVVTAQGVLGADAVVVAAGTGATALLQTVGVALPMLSRPGLILKTPPLPPVLPLVLWGPGGELRQDNAGRLVMPTAANHQGDAAETISGLASLHADAAMTRLRALLPGVQCDWDEVTLAHRPVPGDGLPVIGAALPGLWLAVMHSGATLAAITAELLAAEIDGKESADLAEFRPNRFS
ncbi:FAD-binding oxidoreductase [Xinfangfangia sp. CPCC 101601]|uniref:FAD-binding oxidoreductase n=1 Tax=Pseudogemmobacter lacusdianii TaxID=3069608 RepID=A0ABU0W0X4_9RHOB|nr:FAD-binding oxidoreductase [Xinfangfangia sp. CPCC 101601]MDQ2067669.1 FAD-binding oxidoreductase [Xinfangfangia sp. CPCC 101601]